MPIRTALTRSLLAVSLAAAVIATAAGPARAGTYDVRSCSANSLATPPTPVAGVDDAWTFETDDTTHFEKVQHCPPADDNAIDPPSVITPIDGFGVQTRLNSGGPTIGRSGHWRFDAPAGTTLTHVRLWRYAGKQTNDWELYTKLADGTKLSGSDCVRDPDEFFCIVGGPGVMSNFAGLSTTSVRVGMACSFQTSCSTGGTLHDAWSTIYASVVTVDDPTPPTASGGIGTLFAGGFVHGTVTAGVSSASDASGIRNFRVRSDGSVAATSADRSSCDFTRRKPCADISAPESFSFDSAAIADGTHTVQVGAIDAAQNFTATRTEQVTVDNTAPAAPAATSATSLTTDATATTTSWAEPGGQVAPITTARVTVCGPGGCQTTTQAAGGGTGSAGIALPVYGAYSVGVALQDAAGNVDANHAATWSIVRPAPVTATTPSAPIGSAPPAPVPAPAKASPRLALARPTVARDRRTLSVRGSVAAGVSGTVTVTASARIGGRTRTVKRMATIRNRRYSARVRLPSGTWETAKVTVRYSGNATRKAATVTRTIRRPAPRR
jgi:hypothetical protein